MISFSAMKHFIERRLNTICMNFEIVYATPSEEAIHDLRVAMRRMVCHIRFLQFVYDQSEEASARLKKEHRRLRRSLKALNRLRDLQIQIAHIESASYASPCPDVFLSTLASQASALSEDLTAVMDRWTLQRSRKRLRRLLQEHPIPDKELELRSNLYMHYLTQQLHESVQICQQPDICGCHALRLRLKEYRYHLELLEQGFGIRQLLIGAVKQWQEDLGILQDRRTLMELLRRFPEPSEALAAYQEEVQRDLEALLETVAEEAHAIRYETQIR